MVDTGLICQSHRANANVFTELYVSVFFLRTFRAHLKLKLKKHLLEPKCLLSEVRNVHNI